MTLSADAEDRILRKALLSRKVEERLLDLFSQGKLFGTVHTCIGQEFSGAVVTEFLGRGDSIFSNHRCHGHYLSYTGDAAGLMGEVMGRKIGTCGGIGGSQHLCKDGFYSNGIQGGIVPVAAGLAFARKLRGDGKISTVFIGDGTLGEGVIYETFNIASKWRLPLLIVLENNGYAQSTCSKETLAGGITARLEAFGIRTFKGDTWDWARLYRTAEEAAALVRGEGAPVFLQIDTFRLKAHSKGDDNRPRSEVEPFEKRDPLNILLAEKKPGFVKLEQAVEKIVAAAAAAAEDSPYPTLTVPQSANGSLQSAVSWLPYAGTKARVVTALNHLFLELMQAHPEMLFFGEDVKSPYGGAFKVSKDLSDRFPDRVLNAPISEAALVGIGSGLGLDGFRPFVEIMFGDFLELTFDQLLNHAAKFEQMYNGQTAANVVVRTPMGGGRGYGPTHSQTLDRHFFGMPGLRILALNNLIEPGRLYRNLVGAGAVTGPSLVLENKLLYGTYLREQLPAGFAAFASEERFPAVHIKPEAARVDVTLVGYGGMSEALVQTCDRLFEEHDLVAQVLVPMQIFPFSIRPYLETVKAGSRLVIVEEGQGFAGFGAEVLAQLAEIEPTLLRRVRRITAAPQCIAASGPVEQTLLPGVDSIVASVAEMF